MQGGQNEEGIFVMERRQHAYVLLNLACEPNICLLADGENHYMDNNETRLEIDSRIGAIETEPIRCPGAHYIVEVPQSSSVWRC